MTENQTAKQHFIPKLYLKNFEDQTGHLQVLDIKNNRCGKPRTRSGVGYKYYFYAAETGIADEVSQQIEKWLGVFEDTIGNDLPNIINKIVTFQQIDHNDRYTLSALMCMLWLRTPKMRDHLNSMNEDMSKQRMRFFASERIDQYQDETGKEVTENRRKELIKMLENGSYKLSFNNAQHLRFMTESFGFGEPGFTNLFYGHKWRIYIAKGKKRFITTDSPIAEWWLPSQTFYGTSFLGRIKYFALTPEIFFELTYPRGSTKIRRETLFESDDEKVDLFNILLAAHGHEFAYANNKAPLEKLISGRNKPGKLEKEYFEKFEKPWVIARQNGFNY